MRDTLSFGFPFHYNSDRTKRCTQAAELGGFQWLDHLGGWVIASVIPLTHSQSMTDLSKEANTYRVALLVGATDVGSVIAWADRQIEASTIPPNPLIDISLGRSSPLASMVAHLAELTENTKDPRSIKNAFAMVADRIRDKSIDLETAIMNCYRFLHSEGLLYHDDFDIFINLEGDLSLIRDGIFGQDRLPQLQADLLEALDSM